MKKLKTLTILACLALMLSPAAFGRIGETPPQCDERYGKPTFTYTEGDLESRFYRFTGKRINVIFYQSTSVEEVIITGPQYMKDSQEGSRFVSENYLFIRDLLKSAYHFTEAQLLGIAHPKEVAYNEARSDVASNGRIRAFYWMINTDDQTTATFYALIFQQGDYLDRLPAFLTESNRREEKKNQENRVKGF